MSFVNLVTADLTDASAPSADLSHSDLGAAELKGTDLGEANLSDASLRGAEMGCSARSCTGLYKANLTRTDLTNASLKGAALYATVLEGATLTSTDLTGAHFYFVDLGHAVFEPTSIPEVRGIAGAKNLETMTYVDHPDALVQLRKEFADGGFREQERKLTYALKRREAELLWDGCKSRGNGAATRAILWSSDGNLANCGSFLLNRVFFDWTCQYGMSPGRPLSIGVLLWLLCSMLYFICIHVPGRTGLYRVYVQDTQEDPSPNRRVEEILPTEMKSRGLRRIVEFVRRESLILRTSMFFSLMSAFNIGFREIDFGRWLKLLTRQEFDIKAVGWARVIAGWQSLISVCLLALCVLTYFGRPFE